MKKVWEALEKGPGMLICDFDGTLTMGGSSMHAAVHILGPESAYSKEREALYERYGWVKQVSPGKERDRKTAQTGRIWWEEQMKLYIRHCVRQETLEAAAETLVPRPEAVKLVQRCLAADIPVWIVSAGVTNVIVCWLKRQGLADERIRILANRIRYEDGIPAGYEEAVTAWNKAERFFSLAGDQKGRKLVFLGDNVMDLCWRMEDSESFLIEKQSQAVKIYEKINKSTK
ncbi:MAG: haloacid dehalogenase-like hydrolase [Clostridiales bacterium]|nr:haloacid dehalogenase-like hydrolase [Clostridiales bacterium]